MAATCKHLAVILILSGAWGTCTAQELDPYTCTFRGKSLSGRIQRVTCGADLRVQVVDIAEDLRVDTTVIHPAGCGEWKYVDFASDLKVQIVNHSADLQIRYVTLDAGIAPHLLNRSPAEINTFKCTFRGIPLYGKVQFVEHFPDFKIMVVEHFADIDVQLVGHFPDECGEWQVVNSFPDFSVKIVEHFGDIRVRFVDHFPGVKEK